VLIQDGESAWLIDASYSPGQVILTLLGADNLEPTRWSDANFHPYYLTEKGHRGEPIKKVNLFTQQELTLQKVIYSGKSPKNIEGWELEIDPALSYVYDKKLRFGGLHKYKENAWHPQVSFETEDLARFNKLFGESKEKDPLKYSLVEEAYCLTRQPVPRIDPTKLGLPEGSAEDYTNAFLLSRIANLPLTRTYKNYSVSEWIRSMLNTYYRAHDIIIPNSEELTLGDTRKFVTGALTIAPESGTYFNMHVLDFESLYPGCIDVFNLSYETVRCGHSECKENMVPGLDYHICTQRRGIYSALIGALRDLRLRVFKPYAKSAPSEVDENMKAASRILKLFLVSCYGVTVRIHGLASPLLGEAITAYGRHVLQSTWDTAKQHGLKPKYGDTDSIFLDNPKEEDARELIHSIKNRFRLELAPDRIYSVCVLSAAKKAYFGIMPNGEPEIKGLSIAKSNSPKFFRKTFQDCLTKLCERRNSRDDFEQAKRQLPDVVRDAIRDLREGRVELADLEYRVELREDPQEKSEARTLPQPYQAALLLSKEGKKASRGDTVGFIKVHPFKLQGRQFTVKPSSQTSVKEVNVEDYIRNLISSLSRTFEPMSINIQLDEIDLTRFT
jgi:DNA polymerase elongation subunit (family B)